MMPPESSNPIDYMSPLWKVLLILGVLAFILYLVARPLHKYITDRKTEKILRDQKLDSGAVTAEEEPAAKGGGEKPEAEKPKTQEGGKKET